MRKFISYKVITCNDDNPSHLCSNIYQDFSNDPSFWETKNKVMKTELLIGLSVPSPIRTIVIENHNCTLIEVLGGNSGDELDDYHVLLPVHCLRTIQEVKNKEKEKEVTHIRCSQNTNGKYDRIRVILRHYKPNNIGLRSLQLSTTRYTQREQLSPQSSHTSEDSLNTESKNIIKKENKNINKEDTLKDKPKKEEITEEKKTEKKSTKPLKGVTIVISGIVNPERSEIRDKACKLGASYSPSWNKKSTHLICSVFNQQKCSQAKKDKKPIVMPQWIHKCYSKKEKLDVKKYILEEKTKRNSRRTSPRRKKTSTFKYDELSDDSLDDISDSISSDESIDEDWNSEDTNESHKSQKKSKSKMKSSIEDDSWGITDSKPKKKQNKVKKIIEEQSDSLEEDISMEDIENNNSDKMSENESEKTEEMDESDIKVAMNIEKVTNNDTMTDEKEDSSEDLNENIIITPPGKRGPIDILPDFMSTVKCYFYIKDENLCHKAKKYVAAYNGVIDKFLYTDTTHLVTDQDWESSFSNAIDQMPSLQIIRPSWILESHKLQKLQDTYDHLVPDDE